MTNLTPNNLPEILYHYCALQSFTGIVKTSTLHLCAAKYSNDPNESKISETILNEIIESQHETNKKAFLDEVNKKIKTKDWTFFNTPYVFCLSEKNDDLNQWRIYSDNGRGVMMAFKTTFFKTKRIEHILIDEFIKGPRLEELYLDQCIYEHQAQKTIIDQLINTFSSLYHYDAIGKASSIFAFFHYFNFFSAFFKDESYKEEKEWRLVCFPIDQQAFNNFKYKVNYRVKRSVIIPYIEIPIDSSFENALFKKILIGVKTINSRHEIMNFIQNCNFHANTVGRSAVKIQEID